MRKILGYFTGTGAELKIGIGFKPDYVKVTNVTSATLESIEWNAPMADITAIAEGIKRSGDESVDDSKLTATNGISTYDGGDVAEDSQTTYLVQDPDTGEYAYTAADEDDVIPAGFALAADSDVKVNAEVCVFEAGFFD